MLQINPKFKKLIPPLSFDERAQLEANLIQDGCREPIAIWVPDPSINGSVCPGCHKDVEFFPGDGVWTCGRCGYGAAPIEEYIIDGHNRFEICTEHGIDFDTVEIELPDEEACCDWIDKNQLGRRNLSPDQMSLLRGRRYNRTKKAPHRPLKGGQNVHLNSPKTAESLAAEHGVAERTIRRDGDFAAAVEKLGIPDLVTSGEVDAPKKAIITAAATLPENPTEEQRKEAVKHVHVAQNSGENEWYTPADYIEAARIAMGKIDIDPASCDEANKVVKAARFFTKDDDGLSREWHGAVWMNPPYSSSLIGRFVEKLVSEFECGRSTEACVLVNNATETKWFQFMAARAAAICFPAGRVKFWHPHRTTAAPLQGQAVVYIGKNSRTFTEAFARFGLVFSK